MRTTPAFVTSSGISSARHHSFSSVTISSSMSPCNYFRNSIGTPSGPGVFSPLEFSYYAD